MLRLAHNDRGMLFNKFSGMLVGVRKSKILPLDVFFGLFTSWHEDQELVVLILFIYSNTDQ